MPNIVKNLSYSQLLKLPEWKAKRSEIIERDKCCQKCGSISYLQVHHKYYTNGAMPWEYDDNALVLLCSKCHKKEHLIGLNYKYIQVTMNDTEHIEMLTGNQYKLTGILAKYIQFETNIIELSPNQKKRLADSMGLKIRTFYTLFNSLKDAGWIMDHRGYTIMNPMYIWAGKVSNRSKLIEEIKEDRLEAI